MTGNVQGPGRAAPAALPTLAPAAAEALQRLLDGNRRFVAETRAFPNQAPLRRRELAAGQKPFAAILGCSDSRVVPEIIFDQGLGDLFVARVAGNIVDPALRASLGYAIDYLGVPLILVLGHTGCGAVQAALAPGGFGARAGELAVLLAAIEPAIAFARREVGDSNPELLLAVTVRANVRLAVSQLQSGSGVDVVGALYDLASGTVEIVQGRQGPTLCEDRHDRTQETIPRGMA